MTEKIMFKYKLINEIAILLITISFLLFSFLVKAEIFDINRIEIKRSESELIKPIVISSISTFKAGEKIPAHFHNGIETAYVIQGAKLIKDNGEVTKMNTGDTLFNLQNNTHGGVTIAPENELKLFTVHIVDKDKPLFNFVAM